PSSSWRSTRGRAPSSTSCIGEGCPAPLPPGFRNDAPLRRTHHAAGGSHDRSRVRRVASLARWPSLGGGLGRPRARCPRSRRKEGSRRPFPVSVVSAICFDWLHDGRLLVVSSRDGVLLRAGPDGSMRTHADLTGISNRVWNEIVVDGRGNAYVNGTGVDLTAGEKFSPGMIALVTADGSARCVADGIAFPNGMAVTPDGASLIVAESYGRKLTAFDITPDGGLSKRRVWADLGDGAPDGICL